jgi:hypothetical protein
MREKLSLSIYRSEQNPLAMEFHCRDGRVFGLPYNHLLSFLHEANPDAELQPNAPAERILLSFATHEVVLLGWSLKGIVPLLCVGQLASVHVADIRYLATTENAPFVRDMSIHPVSSK